MTVTLTGYLRCDTAEQAASVEKALPEHIRLTRAEPGCLSFEVERTEDSLVWRVAEEFDDLAAFEAHQTRASQSDWAKASAGIPRDYYIKGLE
jgi:quinol monooxygenase YgiN